MCPFPMKYGPAVENKSTLKSTVYRHILSDMTVTLSSDDNVLNTLSYIDLSVALQ